MARGAARGRHYETSLDRIGLAIGTGGLIGGAIAALLTMISGESSPLGILVALAAGTVMTALGITALAIIPWTFLHMNGRRGPVSAALLGGVIGFVLFLGGQTSGYGLFVMPLMDSRTLFFRWASGIATSVVMAAITAGVGVVMWRVAYRRIL